MNLKTDILDFRFGQTRLDQGSEVFRLLELVQELDQIRTDSGGLHPKRLEILAQLVFREAHVAQFNDVGTDEVTRAEEAAGFFPCLEDEGQLGELGGAGADFRAVEIVLQD